MSTPLNDRQQIIVTLIRDRGPQAIADLSDRFGVASQTVRRDINELCELGLARRTHGGVAPALTTTLSFTTRRTMNEAAKRAIGQAAAALIPPGSTVFLGIGTTVQFTAEALLGVPDLTLVTNNLEVGLLMCREGGHRVVIAGGELRPEDRDMTGAASLAAYGSILADVAVIGAGALHPDHGVLDHKQFDAELGAVMIRNAARRILVTDHSKWDLTARHVVAGFDRFDVVVTDAAFPVVLGRETELRCVGG